MTSYKVLKKDAEIIRHCLDVAYDELGDGYGFEVATGSLDALMDEIRALRQGLGAIVVKAENDMPHDVVAIAHDLLDGPTPSGEGEG